MSLLVGMLQQLTFINLVTSLYCVYIMWANLFVLYNWVCGQCVNSGFFQIMCFKKILIKCAKVIWKKIRSSQQWFHRQSFKTPALDFNAPLQIITRAKEFLQRSSFLMTGVFLPTRGSLAHSQASQCYIRLQQFQNWHRTSRQPAQRSFNKRSQTENWSQLETSSL